MRKNELLSSRRWKKADISRYTKVCLSSWVTQFQRSQVILFRPGKGPTEEDAARAVFDKLLQDKIYGYHVLKGGPESEPDTDSESESNGEERASCQEVWE